MRLAIGLLLPLGFIGTALAQQQPPSILEGPVNAASYAPPGLANGGLAQGSMFILKGLNLGACGAAIARIFPLQGAMGGTAIRITVGGTTMNALMIYVVACRQGAPDQLAAIVPSNLPLGTGTVVVTYANRASAAAPVRVVRASFGMFTRNQAGDGPAIVQNFISPESQPVNGLVEAAQPGQLAILWGTGLGAATGNEVEGPVPDDLGTAVDVIVGGVPASVTYRGRSGCCAGIDQIVFTVPPGVAGCYVSVAVRVNGVLSNTGTMSISPNPEACAEPSGFTAPEMRKLQDGGGLTLGGILMYRIRIDLTIPLLGNLRGNIDTAGGSFQRYRSPAELMASNSAQTGLAGLPSAGSCVVLPFPFSGSDVLEAALPDVHDSIHSAGLNAGPALTISGPRGSKQILRSGDGQTGFEYFLPEDEFLGGGIAAPGFPPVRPDYLEPGDYTLDNGAGSNVIGPFRGALTIPARPLDWSNQSALNTIPRAQPLTLTWTGGAAGAPVVIFGTASDVTSKAGAQFLCAARAEEGTFTVPAWVLSALPASGQLSGVPVGFLTVGTTLAQPGRFTATGLDLGIFNWGALQLKNVNFQ